MSERRQFVSANANVSGANVKRACERHSLDKLDALFAAKK